MDDVFTLYFSPAAVPKRPCQTRKEERVNLQMFFDNKTSMRH